MARILIADDDTGYRDAFREGMGMIGHDVTGVATCDAVLPELAATRFDVAFLDVFMDGGGAIALLRMMRDRQDRTPVVVISGRSEVLESPALRDTIALAHAHIAKCITLNDLDALVTRICRDGS